MQKRNTRRRKQEFEVEFINDEKPKEDLQEIMQREFVRFVNEQKGFAYLTIKKQK